MIDNMSNDEVVNELKEKKLPTFGTLVERKDRLKKYYGTLTLPLYQPWRSSTDADSD